MKELLVRAVSHSALQDFSGCQEVEVRQGFKRIPGEWRVVSGVFRTPISPVITASNVILAQLMAFLFQFPLDTAQTSLCGSNQKNWK